MSFSSNSNNNHLLNFLDVDLSCFSMSNFTGANCNNNNNNNSNAYYLNGYSNNLTNFNNNNNSNNSLTSTNYLFNSNPNLSTSLDVNNSNSLAANISNCAEILSNNGSNYISQSMDPLILLDNYKKDQLNDDLASPILLPKSSSSATSSSNLKEHSSHTIKGTSSATHKFLYKDSQDTASSSSTSNNIHSLATASLSTSSLSLPLTSEHSYNSLMSNTNSTSSSPYRISASHLHLSNFQLTSQVPSQSPLPQLKSQQNNRINSTSNDCSSNNNKYLTNHINNPTSLNINSHRSSLPISFKSETPTMPSNSSTSLFTNQKANQQHHFNDPLSDSSASISNDISNLPVPQQPPLCEFSTNKAIFNDDFHSSIDSNLAISPSNMQSDSNSLDFIKTHDETINNDLKNDMETNNNDLNKNDHQHDPFQIDDYNLATPTEVEPLLQHTAQIIQDKSPQVDQYNEQQDDQKMLLSPNIAPSSPSPRLSPSPTQKPAKQTQHMSKQIQYNTQIQSYLGSFNQNSFVYNGQMSMNTPTNGFLSRSNSQPDLTINLEKLLPIPNNYNYNNCYQNGNSNMSNTGSGNNGSNYYFINQNVNANNYHSGYGGTNNGLSSNSGNYYTNNPNQTVITINNKTKQIRRHPSLSYKTSMSECHEENEDYFSYFNLTDYLNHNNFNNDQFGNGLNNHHLNNNNCFNTNPNGMNIDNCSNQNLNMSSSGSTTSGVSSLATTNATDDGLFLGIDAINDFLSKSGTYSDIFEDLPDLEDLMSLVTFETSSSVSTSSAPASQPIKQTQCDLNLPNVANNLIDCNPMSNFYDYGYGVDMNSLMMDHNVSNDPDNKSDEANVERTTRSAPPSPTPQRKKQRPTNLPWHKAWNKMDDDERSRTVECLTRIINDEMGLREQLEIIRILNPDTKLKPTDTQFIIDLKMIDDEKFKRIKEIIKVHGLSLNEKQISDNSSDCSANSCPLAKRELRIKRAQQRLKLKLQKEKRQMVKETKSGLFSKTEEITLIKVLPEEDIDIDILS